MIANVQPTSAALKNVLQKMLAAATKGSFMELPLVKLGRSQMEALRGGGTIAHLITAAQGAGDGQNYLDTFLGKDGCYYDLFISDAGTYNYAPA